MESSLTEGNGYWSDRRDALVDIFAQAQEAQIRMQTELMLERIDRYLGKQAAYWEWYRERRREG